MTDLLESWTKIMPAGADPVTAGAAGLGLLERWREPHRRYHTVGHLAAILSIVDENQERAEDSHAVRLAAWFHDAVYDPMRPDNEQRSAELAAMTLPALGVAPQRADEVVRLVLLTAHHAADPSDANGALLCDADLAVLASPAPRYRDYVRAVRAEYAHVPDELFNAGRAAVLRALLELPRLFRVPALAQRWEEAARHNVAAELAQRLRQHVCA